jgi:hypothetical protein
MQFSENQTSDVELILNKVGAEGERRLRRIARRKNHSSLRRCLQSVGSNVFGLLSLDDSLTIPSVTLRWFDADQIHETSLNARVCERRGRRFDLLIDSFPVGLTPSFALQSKNVGFAFEPYESRVWLSDQEEDGYSFRLSASDDDSYAAQQDDRPYAAEDDDGSATYCLPTKDEWTHDWSTSDGLSIRFSPCKPMNLKAFKARVQLRGEVEGELKEPKSLSLEFTKYGSTYYANLPLQLAGHEWVDLVVSPLPDPIEEFAIRTPNAIELRQLTKQSHLVRIRQQLRGGFRFENLSAPSRILVAFSPKPRGGVLDEVAKVFEKLRPQLEARAARAFSLKTGGAVNTESPEVQEIVSKLSERLITKPKFANVRKRHDIQQRRHNLARARRLDRKIRTIESSNNCKRRSLVDRRIAGRVGQLLGSLRRQLRAMLIRARQTQPSPTDDVTNQLTRLMMSEIKHLTSDHAGDFFRYVCQTQSPVGEEEVDFFDNFHKSPVDRRTVIRNKMDVDGVVVCAIKKKPNHQKPKGHAGTDKLWAAIDFFMDQPNWISYLPDGLIPTLLLLIKVRTEGAVAIVGGDSIEALARYKHEAEGLSFDGYTDAQTKRVIDDLRRQSDRIVYAAMDVNVLMEFQSSGRSPGQRLLSREELELVLRTKVKGQTTHDLLCDSNPPLALSGLGVIEEEIDELESRKSNGKLTQLLRKRLKELKLRKKELVQSLREKLVLAQQKLDVIVALSELRGMKKVTHRDILFVENWLLRPKNDDHNNSYWTTQVDVETERKRLGRMVHASILTTSDEFRRSCGNIGRILLRHVAMDSRTIDETKELIEAELKAKKRTIKFDYLEVVRSVLEVWHNRIESSLVPTEYLTLAEEVGQQIFTLKLALHEPDPIER